MNEATGSDAPLPVMPVEQSAGPVPLTYATSGGIQPPDSRFIYEALDDGVRLTEPAQSFRGWRTCFSGLLLGIVGFIIVRVGIDEGRYVVLVGLGFLAFAFVVVGEGWRQCTLPLIIEGRPHQLSITYPSLWTGPSVWKRSSIKSIAVPSLSISIDLKPISRVMLVKKAGLPTTILSTRPKDECLWVASTLRQAMGIDQPGSG